MVAEPTLVTIDPSSVSFTEIRQNLIEYARTLPDAVVWRDWLESSETVVIVEWLAGMGAFFAYQNLSRRREGSLDHAQLDSSVFELAAQRGLLVEPTNAAELTLRLTSVGRESSLEEGQEVAIQGEYMLYAKEAYRLPADIPTNVTVVVGVLRTFIRSATNFNFLALVFDLEHRYIGSQLERFTAGTLDGGVVVGVPIELRSDPQYDLVATQNYVLRRTVPNGVLIYTGNGTLGWTSSDVSAVSYRVLTYDGGITSNLRSTPDLTLDGHITLLETAVALLPSFDPDRESVRATARFYPRDGNIVHDRHYEAVIRKQYAGVLHDVFSKNTDPNQEVYLLKRVNFGGSGSELETANVAAITSLVNGRRAFGIRVSYECRSESDGVVIDAHFRVPREALTSEFRVRVQGALDVKRFRFMREETTVSSVSLATELSAQFGVQLIPLDPVYEVVLGDVDFVRFFDLSLVL